MPWQSVKSNLTLIPCLLCTFPFSILSAHFGVLPPLQYQQWASGRLQRQEIQICRRARRALDGTHRRRRHRIISHSGNPTFLQFLQFLGPPPSFLPSFHPSHSAPPSRSYVRSISYPALRSNPSDPTYSKAAAMPCSPSLPPPL